MHPILDSLNGSPHEWLKRLLFTFNEGSIGKFEALAPLFPQEVRDPSFFLLYLAILIFNSPSSKKTTLSSGKRSA